jgi:hypothetical protein
MHGSDAESTVCLRKYTGLPFHETEIVQHFVKDYLAGGIFYKQRRLIRRYTVISWTRVDADLEVDRPRAGVS